jgi:hypothetical protein
LQQFIFFVQGADLSEIQTCLEKLIPVAATSRTKIKRVESIFLRVTMRKAKVKGNE